MAAIVATLLYLPVCLVLALAFHLLGVPIEPLTTFGGAVGLFTGLGLWWLVSFAGACIYAGCVFPWDVHLPAWPRKR